MFKFPYEEAYWADFESFESNIVDVQFLSGHRPSPEEVHILVVDAYNFMIISDRFSEEGNSFDFEQLGDIF